MENQDSADTPQPETRQPWEPFELTFLGNAFDLVQQGGGKLSTTAGDPGESRKVTGHG